MCRCLVTFDLQQKQHNLVTMALGGSKNIKTLVPQLLKYRQMQDEVNEVYEDFGEKPIDFLSTFQPKDPN